MKGTIAVLLLLIAAPAFAQQKVASLYVGANGVWYAGDRDLPPDFELGGNASASLSPHIAAVGALYYGVNESYVRGSFGARVTATDVQNSNLSVGVGAQYHVSTEPRKRPEELAGDVSIGWKPWPQTMPRVIVGAQAWYGFDSEQAGVLAGVRYHLTSFGNPRP